MAVSILSNALLRISLNGTETETVGAISRTAVFGTSQTSQRTWGNGTSNGSANCLASITGTVGTAAQVSLDLTNLVGVGIDDPLTLTGIKCLVVQDVSTTNTPGNTMILGDTTGSVSNAWTTAFPKTDGALKIDTQSIGILVASTNNFSVGSTAKILTLTAVGGTVSYQIDIIGTK